jgi:hypothetical protein
MASGGARFTRPERPRAAARVIDVEVRPPHKTLYEVLVVPPTTSSRQIRRIARALRRNMPNLTDLDDVCLAEQVLGRGDLRAEYDALMDRARAAKLTLPDIGAAIEGSRLAGPPPPELARVGRASADPDRGGSVMLRVGAVITALALAGAGLGASHRHKIDRDRTPVVIPELPRIDAPPIDEPPPAIDVPRIDPPALGLDHHELRLDKIDPDDFRLRPSVRIELEKLELERLKLDRAPPSGSAPPRPTPARPRQADPAALDTR